MKRNNVILCLLAVFLLVLNGSRSVAYDISPEGLPSITIGYSVYATYAIEFESRWKNGEKPPIIEKLQSEFDKLDCHIDTRMAFTHIAFVVQSNISDHLSGFIDKNWEKNMQKEVPLENILFVTTPVKPMDKKIFVIHSSVSPERTTILWVDCSLNVKLLYDSDKLTTNNIALCSITSVRVKEPGVYIIKERSGKCVPKEEMRTFIVDLRSATFSLAQE